MTSPLFPRQVNQVIKHSTPSGDKSQDGHLLSTKWWELGNAVAHNVFHSYNISYPLTPSNLGQPRLPELHIYTTSVVLFHSIWYHTLGKAASRVTCKIHLYTAHTLLCSFLFFRNAVSLSHHETLCTVPFSVVVIGVMPFAAFFELVDSPSLT